MVETRCLSVRCTGSLTNELETTNDDWTLDPLRAHAGSFPFLFPSLLQREETAATQLETNSKERWRRRRRQTDNLCADVFTFFGLMCLRQPIDGLGGVSNPPLRRHHLLLQGADWSESLLSGRVGTLQAARHCCLHSATSRVSLHATLLTLSSAEEVSQRACRKNQLVAAKLEWLCLYTEGSNEPASNVF